MKLAIIDLDGVVADATARFDQAKADAEAAFVGQAYEKREYDNVYWRAVFNPEYVPLDVLIKGTNDALNTIAGAGYQRIFLTSRPQSMTEATLDWMGLNIFISPGVDIIFKAPAFQYVKTVVWKAGMVQTLEALYEATDLLIVDDEQANIDEHLKYFSNIQTRDLCKSLAEAVAKLNGTWVEPDPFLPPED